MANPNPKNQFVAGNQYGARSKGARQRISDRFLTTLQTDFEQHAETVIERMRTEDNTAYVQMVAKLIPQQLQAHLTVDTTPQGLTADEWDAVRQVARAVASAGATGISKEQVSQWLVEDLTRRMAAQLPQVTLLPAPEHNCSPEPNGSTAPPPCPVPVKG
jgi:hypothetical protein